MSSLILADADDSMHKEPMNMADHTNQIASILSEAVTELVDDALAEVGTPAGERSDWHGSLTASAKKLSGIFPASSADPVAQAGGAKFGTLLIQLHDIMAQLGRADTEVTMREVDQLRQVRDQLNHLAAAKPGAQE
ncbi:MAG TPA: hypothetical protein VGL46_15005 [Pseudonocardiaceae bacterium]|jgi:hypothetical protein